MARYIKADNIAQANALLEEISKHQTRTGIFYNVQVLPDKKYPGKKIIKIG